MNTTLKLASAREADEMMLKLFRLRAQEQADDTSKPVLFNGALVHPTSSAPARTPTLEEAKEKVVRLRVEWAAEAAARAERQRAASSLKSQPSDDDLSHVLVRLEDPDTGSVFGSTSAAQGWAKSAEMTPANAAPSNEAQLAAPTDAAATDATETTPPRAEPALASPPPDSLAPTAVMKTLTPTSSMSSFPVNTIALGGPADPLAAWTALCTRVCTESDYRAARAEICGMAVLLNLEGKLAPAVRPELHVASADKDTRMLMHRDALVVDYHWCHATRMALTPSEAAHRTLMDLGRDFDFGAAWALASRTWKGTFRGDEAMGLSTFEQCQTVKLRGPELEQREQTLTIRQRAASGQFGSPRTAAKRKIREWTERYPQMKPQRGAYEHLWLARELLGVANVSQVRPLLALMTGESAKDPKTIKGKLATLAKVLGE